MLVNQGTKRSLIARPLLLLLAVLLSVWTRQSPVNAQTVLSPTPFMPLHDRVNPGSAIPIAADLENDPEQSGAVEEKIFHIPLIFNESVESQIEYFTTRGRAVFQAWLRRSARYLPAMKKIFREQNLPEDLVYVAMIESGFNPHAVSQKKAVGPWQFMRATAREYGLNTDHWVDERKDPIKSTRAAAAHFKDLYQIFGSWPMVLASYNAGMGRMQGAVLKAKSDDFWELRASRFIHQETQEYVPKYMAALIIAKDPVAYGFRDPEPEPFEYDEIEIVTCTDLRRIAEYTGCSYQEIRDLNPELLLPMTPKSRYVLRIPPGTKEACQLSLAKVSVQERKFRKDRDRARSGGLLFSRLSSSYRDTAPAKPPQTTIVSPFGAQLDFPTVPLGGEGANASRSQALNRPGGEYRVFP
ncbi:MAG: hypothetical protein A2010_13150 [Nitrospirae bacterium GWD2_57_9]|nr:MAG: hypothetical protein A2010_13150 [Nitrospirae bacterium GWD2_57_9]